MTPPLRLKWRRARPGKYVAGPYIVTRGPYHRPIWELTKVDELMALGHYDTAAGAKRAAADDYVATKGIA